MATKNLEELKLQLISDIEQRVTDKILEKTDADLLAKLINQSDSEAEAMNIMRLGTTYKRTGFHFFPHCALNEMPCSNNIKYKAKNEKLSFVNDASRPTHELIIGDNFEALQNLMITHKGKVDVIYIDPPYGKDSMGDFAQTNYNNSITRDNLLSMLYPRLLMARRLLTNEGVIFCSIDDKNQAYVKCLFDEVFEEENCVAMLNWKKKKQPSFLSSVAGVMEYILVYAINKNNIKKLSIDSVTDSNKPVINASNQISERIIRKGCRVKASETKIPKGIYTNRSMTVEYLDDILIQNGRIVSDIRCKAKFRTNQKNIDSFCAEDVLFITKNFSLRRDLTAEESGKAKSITDLLLDWGQNQDGSDELKAILNGDYFDNPKPVLLVKNLVKSTMKSDITILDFFAGSGTTGQSIMELNKDNEGEGKYTYILCTNNEKTTKTPNGVAYDVTTKRLKRIMSGECYDGTKDFPWLNDHKPFMDNLNVYEIAEVSKTEMEAGKTAFDKIDETCYGLPKFENLTDKIKWVCENFENTTKMEG